MSGQSPPPVWQLRPIAYRVAPMPDPETKKRKRKPPAWPNLAIVLDVVASDGRAGLGRFGTYLI
jgi:hypothetical protein